MSDYVVTRKRKRDAVDPCLGYYLDSSSNGVESGERVGASPVEHQDLDRSFRFVPSSLNAERELEVPQVVKLDAQKDKRKAFRDVSQEKAHRHSEENNVVTVEDFLKWSANLPDRKARKALRTRQLQWNSEDPALDNSGRSGEEEAADGLKLPPSPGNGGHSCNPAPPLPPVKRTYEKLRRDRRKRRTLKERLFEAAISTHGTPDDYFVLPGNTDEAADQSRVALHFVPGLTNRHPLKTTRPHATAARNLVDPRRSMSIRTATFSNRREREYSETGVLVNTLDRLPLSKWNLNIENGALSPPRKLRSIRSSELTKRRKKRKDTDEVAPGRVDVVYPALPFISLEDAEERYKVMFASSGDKDRNMGRPPATPNKASLNFIALEDPVHKVVAPVTRTRSPIKTTFAARSLAPPSVFADCNTEDPIPSSCGVTVSMRPPTGDVIGSTGPVYSKEPYYPALASTVDVSPARLPIANRTSYEITTPGPHTEDNTVSSQTNQNGASEDNQKTFDFKRPLRPLGSFMDEFLSNILSVTGPQVTESPLLVQEGTLQRKRPASRVPTTQQPCTVIVSDDPGSRNVPISNDDLPQHRHPEALAAYAEPCLLEPETYHFALSCTP